MIYKVTVAILVISVACKASPILPKLPKFFEGGSYDLGFGIFDGIKDAIDFVLPGRGSYRPETFDLIDIYPERFRPRPGAILETDTIFDIDSGYGSDDKKGIEIDILDDRSDPKLPVETLVGDIEVTIATDGESYAE